MKNVLFLFVITIATAFAPATPRQNMLVGAWRSQTTINGTAMTQVLLFSNGYFSSTLYHSKDGAFFQTVGGSFTVENGMLTLHYEFNSSDSTKVGTTDSGKLEIKGNVLQIKGGNGNQFKGEALDAGITTDLTGAWLMAGRKQNDQITRRDTSTPRKTMKLLSGKRFQWIAYNTETKQFMGTGGGTYTAENGVYTENLEFFSRDNKRVGMKLEFNYEVQGNDWHHSGKSSAGEPMYEIWAKRDLENK
ncbi:MAG: membrane or secreted protein [Saprospiraceae bacterium]